VCGRTAAKLSREGVMKNTTSALWRFTLRVYNFVRIHKTLGTTSAVAAGVELGHWTLEDVVEMTAEYLRRKEDAKFEEGFARREC
jgi:hypothetical protein